MTSVHPFWGVVLLGIAGSAAEAGSPQPFTDEAIARGINFPVQIGYAELGSGLGMFDIDGDGDADAIVMGASDGRVGLYENDGTGQFTNRTDLDGGGRRLTPHTDYAGVSAADYDSDGDLDIYLSRYGAPNVLWRNDGGWSFT
ncbi:MAG: VCBS repeat-containing protein, partial [Phycisphaerales bacterium]|nr:VCBS repeat-containing protein [Phycisphaerales bacterium]